MTKAKEDKATGGYSKLIFESNGVWMAHIYPPGFKPGDDTARALGTFATRTDAERAVEDAIVAAMYHDENKEADDKIRHDQWQEEQDRLNGENERHVVARDVPDMKAVRAPANPTSHEQERLEHQA